MPIEGKTPRTFIEETEKELKEYLQQNDIQINKLGIIGFFINLLGNTKYDVKKYYDKLFQESFLSTSRDDYNILMHSSIHGHNPSFASPSKAFGNFIFDFSTMPRPSSNVEKREVIFYDISFEIEGYRFKTNTRYKFVEEKDNFYCVVSNTENGYSEYVSSSGPLIEAPFYNVFQIKENQKIVRIQNYDYGSFYPIEVEIDEGFFSDIILRVKDPNQPTDLYSPNQWDKYNLEYRKHSGYREKTAFLKRLGNSKILVELGSGEIGTYVPNTKASIVTSVTEGSKGNIQVATEVPFADSTKIEANDFSINESTGEENLVNTYSTSTVNKLGKVSFNYSEGGKDLLTGEDLRKDAIKHIQTRDNLLSEKDFYNIATKHYDDFKFTFKKFQVVDNNFYLHKCFRDEYFNPVKSSSLVLPVIDQSVTPVLSGSVYTADENGLEVGDWEFYIVATDGFNNTNNSNTITLTVDETNNAVELNWDIIQNANSYIIYGKLTTETDYRYWKVTGAEEDNLREEEGGGTYITDTGNRDSNIIFNPVFDLDGKEFISPFVYKFNSKMNWYDGFLLFDNIIVNVNDIYSENESSLDLPVFFFNVWYHPGKATSNVDLKSTADVSDYIFKMSIEEEGIISQSLTEINTNTYRYEFTDSDHGIFWDKISIKLEVFSSTGTLLVKLKTKQFYQIVDIRDQLKIIKYNNTDSGNRLIGIPALDREKFKEDKEYYLDKIYNYLQDVSFSENRMPTDNINFSFLETYRILSDKLKYAVKQEYSSFDLYFPLKLSVDIHVDRKEVRENNINIEDERETLEGELANLLQEKYTGTDIVFYHSRIVDFIHRKEFAKYVSVSVVDNSSNSISDGLETRKTEDIISKINEDSALTDNEKKIKIIEYTPPYFYWDLDNINITVTFD